MSQQFSWPEVQTRLGHLPHWAVALFAVRSARRLWPGILDAEAAYGPEVREWLTACDATLRMVELFAAREPVSRFTLDLAAEIARATALVAANTARQAGYHPSAQTVELTLAAAALSADVARVADLSRAVRIAVQVAQAGVDGGPISLEQVEDLTALEQGEPLLSLGVSCTNRHHLMNARKVVLATRSQLLQPSD